MPGLRDNEAESHIQLALRELAVLRFPYFSEMELHPPHNKVCVCVSVYDSVFHPG